jgi:hypothetical protein
MRKSKPNSQSMTLINRVLPLCAVNGFTDGELADLTKLFKNGTRISTNYLPWSYV